MSELNKVSQDAYDLWLDNEVTQRFFAEMLVNLNEARCEKITGSTNDQLIKNLHEHNQTIETLEIILDWKPSELETND